MIRETELNLLVPSPELLVLLASGEKPLGIPASAPRITVQRETFFDTPDEALRRRGITCKLKQTDRNESSVVVTVGEDRDSEGITSRTRLSTSAVGVGVFETLRGDSEAAALIQKFIEPAALRPRIALDIQRLGRAYRSGILRRTALLLLFDRVTVQVGRNSSVFHEIRIRRRRPGGPLIRDLAQQLKDEHHLFPDGQSTLHRAYRVLNLERRSSDRGLSPYALSLALALFSEGRLGLQKKGSDYCLPTFRGSGEDAARALASDLTGRDDVELTRLGTTEPRAGRSVGELWSVPDPELPRDQGKMGGLTWIPWHTLLERVGHPSLRHPILVSSLLLLTRRRLLGQLPWVPSLSELGAVEPAEPGLFETPEGMEGQKGELEKVSALAPLLLQVEDKGQSLETRIRAVSGLSRGLTGIFLNEVTGAKERVLSSDDVDEKQAGKKAGSQANGQGNCQDDGPVDDPAPIQSMDLISIRVRGMVDRLYRSLNGDLLPAIEEAGVHLRSWSGIMREDRRAFLERFNAELLPQMKVAEEWGPAFIPDMPPEGCAVGLLARTPDGTRTRFFHLVLHPETPSFLTLPGSPVVLPLEEVIRGYLFSQHPELEKSETYLFRFMTGEVTVRQRVPHPETGEPPEADAVGVEAEADPVEGEPEAMAEAVQSSLGEVGEDAVSELEESLPQEEIPTPPTFTETKETVVVRILVRQKMPESQQTQLLRALERQVSRRNPLIGWSDLYPVKGPLELSGLDGLLESSGD